MNQQKKNNCADFLIIERFKMGIGDYFRTCQESPVYANYKWINLTSSTTYPKPTSEKRSITLEKDENFPPIRAFNKGTIWETISFA